MLAKLEPLLRAFAASDRLPPETRLVTLLRVDALVMACIGAIGPSAPDLAPEIYARRKNRDETPIGFVRRVYGEWLGNGLTSADIRQLDPNLYLHLKVWICTKGEPEGLDLPSKKARIDRLIGALGIGGPSDAGRLILERLRAAHKVRVKKARAKS